MADSRPRASREWVVPERPKPGRKPSAATDAIRSSQRACRERKQEYVAELEAKVRRLEDGDGERAALFQQTARALKQANEVLAAENRALRNLLGENDVDLPPALIRKSPPADHRALAAEQQRSKRQRLSPVEERPRPPAVNQHPSLAVVPQPPPQRPPSPAPSAAIGWTHRHDEPQSPSRTSSGALVSCGLCETGGRCLCADVDLGMAPPATHTFDLDDTAPAVTVSPSTSVPIKLRKTPRAALPNVWAIERAPATPVASSCNGDPKTCLACRDDPFGQAFCSALSTSVCATQPCASCPNAARRSPPDAASQAIVAAASPSLVTTTRTPLSSSRDEPVACSDAWRELRAHPNIAFADLRMLADVVARRTHCDGPTPAGESAEAAGRRLTVERGGVERALAMLDSGDYPRGGAPGGEKA